MSGHSKWHTIRRSKGAADQKRGQIFTKLARDIAIATREGGGGDPDMNFRLRLAVDKARQNNMPSDSIQRAIDRGLGKGSEGQDEMVFYEGYASGGVALLIEAATNNRNRTSSDVRSTLTKNGATPGEPGSVAWMFEQKGLITVEIDGSSLDTDEVMLQAIDAGAEDVEVGDGTLEIYTEWTQLNTVRQALMEHDIPITGAEMTMRPTTMVQTGEEKDALQVLRLLEKLEDLDDVQRVYSNLDISDDLLNKYQS
ncbi:MAG: YebC/PmpR family DNA-binding transcriptional regulator [Chloroflexaceae bacterium]|nr:YebC/PmpR family DNA-binding transcriptional regulator [Chloroflexaceae bacterium]